MIQPGGLMLITKSNSWEEGTRKRTIGQEVKLGPLTLKFATIALIAVAALFYLAQSTQGAAQKYQIMQLDEARGELQAKSKELEVEAARLKSLNEIKKSAQDLEPVQESSFYQAGSNI